ncbi:MAG: TIGR03767 family metallophosphoesterase, partial [Actinobacteria bacterium]|nr:TIGR03767 family metallophosphoesterase [Actinomycetota bacterium]
RSSAPIRGGTAFVHSTDIHLIDAQSPARVEFLDRYADQRCESFPLSSAQRPQETLTLHFADAMNRALRRIRRGPVTGRRFSFLVSTGDNVDNEQANELRWFIDLLDGETVEPGSGGPAYEGVQSVGWGDPEYWHPDPVPDKYKERYGFPDYPGLLEEAVAPFQAAGIGIPWWQTFGNHDGLMQGNGPRNEVFEAIAVGGLKIDGPPPGLNPCDPWPSLAAVVPSRPVTPDPDRRVVRRREYVEEHFRTTGTPVGHGFTEANRAAGTAHYVRDDVPPFRFVSLDTVNPGGFADGSIGAAQLAWLEERLAEVHSRYLAGDGSEVATGNADRLVVLFSHHGLRSLNNPVMTPDPDPANAEVNDLPRVLADEVEALLHRFPNVIAWVNGHTHDNVIEPRPDPAGRTAGFWDIGTAAHVDWACQSRIVEVALRADGTLSIFSTMVDADAPVDPRAATGIRRLAAISRELAANDFQYGFAGPGRGTEADRNVELLLPAPAWLMP